MDYTDIIIDIRKIVRSINLESKRIQKAFGVSIPQLLCLTYLSTCKDYQSTQRNMTHYLNLNPSTVSGIIDRLEKKGLIARLPKKGDKRVSYISLTSEGYRLIEKTPSLMHDKLSKKLADLPENKLLKIKEALSSLIQALGIDEIEASPLLIADELISQEE